MLKNLTNAVLQNNYNNNNLLENYNYTFVCMYISRSGFHF